MNSSSNPHSSMKFQQLSLWAKYQVFREGSILQVVPLFKPTRCESRWCIKITTLVDKTYQLLPSQTRSTLTCPETTIIASASLLSDPFESRRSPTTQPKPIQTASARKLYHGAQAGMRPPLTAVQTQEQLENLLGMCREFNMAVTERNKLIHDPPTHNPKADRSG